MLASLDGSSLHEEAEMPKPADVSNTKKTVSPIRLLVSSAWSRRLLSDLPIEKLSRRAGNGLTLRGRAAAYTGRTFGIIEERQVVGRLFPEIVAGGFTRIDGTVAFYARVMPSSLVRPLWLTLARGVGNL